MPTILAPFQWHAPLAAPLALRGLRLCLDPAGAAAAFGYDAPEPPIPWLALVDDEASVIAALDAGADDAVAAAANPTLIAARLARLLRRATLSVADLEIDPITRIASRAGRRLDLLPREYALLVTLARHAGTTVSRAALHATIWGRQFDPGTNVIEVHVSRLRAELDRGAAPMLRTERGRGYRLEPPEIARTAIAS